MSLSTKRYILVQWQNRMTMTLGIYRFLVGFLGDYYFNNLAFLIFLDFLLFSCEATL